LIDDILQEACKLLDDDPEETATTLLLAPYWADALEDWSELGYFLEEEIFDKEDDPLLEGRVGIAFFHPNWTFNEMDNNDPIHFERRAPIPTISLLRKDDIGVYVQDALEKGIILSKKVQDDNEVTLRKYGYDKLERKMSQIKQLQSKRATEH